MRILGIDPGSRITGFGIIERDGHRVDYVESGCIRTGDGAFAERLKVIFDSVRDVVAVYRPAEVAVERVFMHKNPDSALKLGQARGAALCAVMAEGLKVSEYTPAQIKQATVGKGNAAKGQIQHMVQAMLKLPGIPKEDAADALAVALCHLHTNETLSRLAGRNAVIGGRRR